MRSLKRIINHIFLYGSLLTVGAVLPSLVYAEDDRQIWECNSGSYYSEKSEHNLWLVKEDQKAYVKFYDSRIAASYYLYGLERRWDWDGGNFSIRLKPDNQALYFDFNSVEPGETTSSKNTFGCKKIKG